jgi:hypothetical protein
MSRAVRWLALVAAAGTLAGCTRIVGPVRTAEDYELKAASTAEAVLSGVRTAELVVDAADRDRAFASYVAVALDDAESDASGAAATFSSLQPPGPSSDQLRDELEALTADATSTLATLRITARRGDLDRLAAQAQPLGEIADRLAAFAEQHG